MSNDPLSDTLVYDERFLRFNGVRSAKEERVLMYGIRHSQGTVAL